LTHALLGLASLRYRSIAQGSAMLELSNMFRQVLLLCILLVAEAAADPPTDWVICWGGPQHNPSDPNDHELGNNNGELASLLKLIDRNTPWIRKVFVLQNPPLANPRSLADAKGGLDVELVNRCQLFPRSMDCPTFNSHACQSVVHRVDGLAEHFVLGDDDIFPARPLTFNNFFQKEGRPWLFHGSATAVSLYSGGEPCTGARTPQRMEPFIHVPMPMLQSFANETESEFGEWYGFVRSHKERFECHPGGDLDEDLRRVYPMLLQQRNAGTPHEEPDGYCEAGWGQLECLRSKVCHQNFVNAQNVQNVADWHHLETVLLSPCQSTPVSLAHKKKKKFLELSSFELPRRLD